MSARVAVMTLLALEAAVVLENNQLQEPGRERKRAEEVLRGGEMRFRTFVDQATNALGRTRKLAVR